MIYIWRFVLRGIFFSQFFLTYFDLLTFNVIVSFFCACVSVETGVRLHPSA